eukprot:9681-Heterococcus_DN1.PRE.1
MDFGFARGGTAPAASRGSKREAASRLGLQSRGTTGVQVSLVFDLGTSAAAAGRTGAAADKRNSQPAQKQGRVRAAGFWRGSDAPPAPSVRAKDQPRSTAAQSSQRGKTLSSQRAIGQRRQSASTRRSSDAHDMAHYEFDAAGSDGDSNNSDDDGQSLMTQEHRSALQNRRMKSVRSSAAAAGRYAVSSSPVLLSSASESGLNSSPSCMRSPSHGHDTGLALPQQPQQQSRAKGGIVDIMADLPPERERDVSSASVDIDNDDGDSSAAAAVPAAAAQYNNNSSSSSSSSSSVWTAMKTSLLSSLGQAQHHHTSSSSRSNGNADTSSSVTRPPLVPAAHEPELLLSARGRAVAALGGSEHAATSSRNGLDLQQLDYERSTMDRTGRLGRVASARLLRTADASTAATAAAVAAGEYSAGARGKLCTAAPRHKSAGVTRRSSDVVLTLHGTRAELVPRDAPCDSSSTAGSTYGTGTGTSSSATAAAASATLQRRRSAMGSRGGTAGSELFSTVASTAYDGPPVAAAALTWMTDAEGMANFSRRPPSRQREAFPTHLASEAPFSVISSSSGGTQQQQQQRQQQSQQQQQQPRRDAFLSAAAASAELHASQSQQRQQQQAAFAHAAVTIGTAAA